MNMTLMGCSAARVVFHYRHGGTQLAEAAGWVDTISTAKQYLRARSRRAKVTGYAGPDEAATSSAVESLARARAATIARELAKRGISQRRIDVEVGDAAALRAIYPTISLERVTLTFDPPDPLREDFEVGSEEYERFCGY